MPDRGIELKKRQRLWGLKDGEVQKAIDGSSIDTIRKLGKAGMSDDLLNELEAGIERARLNRIKVLQSTG